MAHVQGDSQPTQVFCQRRVDRRRRCCSPSSLTVRPSVRPSLFARALAGGLYPIQSNPIHYNRRRAMRCERFHRQHCCPRNNALTRLDYNILFFSPRADPSPLAERWWPPRWTHGCVGRTRDCCGWTPPVTMIWFRRFVFALRELHVGRSLDRLLSTYPLHKSRSHHQRFQTRHARPGGRSRLPV